MLSLLIVSDPIGPLLRVPPDYSRNDGFHYMHVNDLLADPTNFAPAYGFTSDKIICLCKQPEPFSPVNAVDQFFKTHSVAFYDHFLKLLPQASPDSPQFSPPTATDTKERKFLQDEISRLSLAYGPTVNAIWRRIAKHMHANNNILKWSKSQQQNKALQAPQQLQGPDVVNSDSKQPKRSNKKTSGKKASSKNTASNKTSSNTNTDEHPNKQFADAAKDSKDNQVDNIAGAVADHDVVLEAHENREQFAAELDPNADLDDIEANEPELYYHPAPDINAVESCPDKKEAFEIERCLVASSFGRVRKVPEHLAGFNIRI